MIKYLIAFLLFSNYLNAENHLQKLSNIFPQSKIYVVTPNKKLNIPKQKKSNIILVHDLDTFIQLLDS